MLSLNKVTQRNWWIKVFPILPINTKYHACYVETRPRQKHAIQILIDQAVKVKINLEQLWYTCLESAFGSQGVENKNKQKIHKFW